MLAEWDKKHPSRAWSIFNALSNVAPSHLMDRSLFDFANLKPTGVVDPEGDLAFDPPSFESTTEARDLDQQGASSPAEPILPQTQVITLVRHTLKA